MKVRLKKKKNIYVVILLSVIFLKSVGSVKSGVRPALIISNDKGNTFSTTVTVAPVLQALREWIFLLILLFVTINVV